MRRNEPSLTMHDRFKIEKTGPCNVNGNNH